MTGHVVPAHTIKTPVHQTGSGALGMTAAAQFQLTTAAAVKTRRKRRRRRRKVSCEWLKTEQFYKRVRVLTEIGFPERLGFSRTGKMRGGGGG